MIQKMVLSEQVKEALLDDILSERVKPGDRLVESQIARDMGISQSPVREALRDLVAMRFVELVPHKGARVRQIKRREILEIYPVRACLEELAGQLAIENIGNRCDELEEIVDGMTEAFRAEDARQMALRDVQFHRTILEATGNKILIETWNSLMIEARTFVTLKSLMATQPDLDLAGRHQPIIDALRAGDPIKCGAVMRSHVEEFGTVMQDLLSSDQAHDLVGDSLVSEVDVPNAALSRAG